LNEATPEYEKNKFRLQVAMESRRFEIDLLWRRSLFFWGFITAAFGGFTWASTQRPTLAIVFSVIAFVFSFIWSLVNRGSRYWHVNWELKVQALEDDVIGPMFKTQSSDERGLWWSGRRYSPSRLMIALSDYVTFVAFMLLASQVFSSIRVPFGLNAAEWAAWIFAAGSLGWALLVRGKTRRHR
jgi:hypothetical protein